VVIFLEMNVANCWHGITRSVAVPATAGVREWQGGRSIGSASRWRSSAHVGGPLLARAGTQAYLSVVAKLLALFTIVPLVELYLLLVLGQWMGFWPTVAVVLVTAMLGAFLGKREGLRVWRSWQESLAQGRMPEEGILGGVLVLVGGVLLVTPGVLTDLTGLMLLFPPTRRRIAKIVRKHLEKRFAVGSTGSVFQYRVDLGNGNVAQGFRQHFGGFSASGSAGGVIDTEGEVVEERRRGEPKAKLQE
jgi:UPF0716 protein FxsA